MATAKRGEGARAKLRRFFLENVGEVVDSATLFEVSGGTNEFGRRIRELRNEEGFDIQTHNDRSDLKPGQYILVSDKRNPAFARAISKETRAFVIERNGMTCRMCGIGAGEPHPDDNGRKARMHIGHVVDKSMGGDDSPDNLRMLCSVCNEGASNISMAPPEAAKVMAMVRKTRQSDQVKVLEWLVERFPGEAKKFLS